MTLHDEYTTRRNRALEPVAQRLQSLLTEYCAQVPRIDRVTVRAKSIERFIQKAAKEENGKRKYSEPLNEIQDQIGARIVTYYLSDVDQVANAVIRYFKPVEQKLLIPDSDSEFGYVGRHWMLIVPRDAIDDGIDADLVPRFFELQIKTLFQHAWSEANHDLAYKGCTPLSSDQRRMIAYTAAQAWGADEMFKRLVSELSGSSDN